jgi:hypothetical protein
MLPTAAATPSETEVPTLSMLPTASVFSSVLPTIDLLPSYDLANILRPQLRPPTQPPFLKQPKKRPFFFGKKQGKGAKGYGKLTKKNGKHGKHGKGLGKRMKKYGKKKIPTSSSKKKFKNLGIG